MHLPGGPAPLLSPLGRPSGTLTTVQIRSGFCLKPSRVPPAPACILTGTYRAHTGPHPRLPLQALPPRIVNTQDPDIWPFPGVCSAHSSAFVLRLLCKDVPLQTTWGGRSPLRCPLQGETTCLPDHPQGSRHGSSPASSPHRPRFLSVTTSVLAPQRRSCCLAPVNASPAGRCSRKAYGPGE